MALLQKTREGEVVVLRLDRGKANALQGELVDELASAIEEVARDEAARALVLGSARPRLFCAGFDVEEVFAYDRAQMLGFFTRFVRLFERCWALPKPVVAALSGHAFAGGAILALAADFRVMADTATLSVNEVDLAVELPPGMIRVMAASAGPELSRSMLLGAEVVSAERALAAGLVSEVAAEAEVLQRAVARARALGAKPSRAFAAHKHALKDLVLGVVSEADIEHTIEAWFSAEASARRQALRERLAPRKT